MTLLRTLFETLPAAVAVLDGEGRVLMVNRAWEAARAGAGAFAEVGDVLPEGALLDRDYETGPGGRWFRVRVTPLPDRPGHLIQQVDITDLRAKAPAQAGEDRFRIMAEASPVAIFLTTGGRIQYANSAAVRLLHGEGAGQLLGKALLAFVARRHRPRAQARLRVALAKGDEFPVGVEDFRCLDGAAVEVETVGRVTTYHGRPALLVFAQDLTLRRQEAEHELQSRKDESLVLMAGSIAHDFNNLFASLSASMEVAELQSRNHPELVSTLATARKALRRAISLSRKMNDFSGRAVHRMERLRLADLLTQWAAAWGALHGPPGPALLLEEVPRVKGDPARLGKVLDAIVENAREAMDEAGLPNGGVTLRLFLAQSEDASGDLGRWMTDRPKGPATVCLEVANDGPCPGPEVLARMFDPFFTTRFLGRGLGLASVLGLLKAHHAGIHVLPLEPGGMAFRIHFPPV